MIELGYALNVNEGFRLWLQIAQNGAQSESVPKSRRVYQNSRLNTSQNMNCPNRALKQKKKINCMQSSIPLKVAMDVFDKQRQKTSSL
ncbi:hypothetical protein [Paenibacillus sp. HGF7]|uniref:hypothetical protein n=1 Tax=Paenibacillus sp. HGF7 TaxID=944559 RepID=UPI0014793591|nr:hypothetical protein [Paenibacillus sp. HGF7]MBV6715471.1 hypothetical protein [Paenibacillus chitinolyticus]